MCQISLNLEFWDRWKGNVIMILVALIPLRQSLGKKVIVILF